MTKGLVAIIGLVLLAAGFLALRSSDEAMPVSAPPPNGASDTPDTPRPTDRTTAAGTTATRDYDPRETWLAIEAQHARHPEVSVERAHEDRERLEAAFSALDGALVKDARVTHLRPKVIAVDCRERSCTSVLEFRDFPTAAGYVEMVQDGRFAALVKQGLQSECPLATTAFPRIRGTEQKDFRVLMHFECK